MALELLMDKRATWVVAYINRDFIYRVEQDIDKFCKRMGNKIEKPAKMKAYIPTVRILRKQFKGKEIFEEVPFLFNYGFFQIPNENLDVEFLIKMKETVMAIHQWVKDPKEVMAAQPELITDKEIPGRKELIQYAIASPQELSQLIKAHQKCSVYDKFDIDNLTPGRIINLRGYPFDNIDAKIISVDKAKEKVKVELLVEGIIKKSTVSFSNVLYTIYHGTSMEEIMEEKSIEEISKGKQNKLYTQYDQENE